MRRFTFLLSALLTIIPLHGCSVPSSAGGPGASVGGTTGTDIVIFSNDNLDAVKSGPTADTTFTTEQSYRITFIRTYHWNDGAGTEVVGSISLLDANGVTVGTWPCQGAIGQGGAPNAYWDCRPDIEIGPGTYSIVDSDPDTWSHNSSSGNAGICQVMGIAIGGGTHDGFGDGPVEPESTDPTPVASGVDTELHLSDGTKIVLPAITATSGGTLTELTLERDVNDQDLSGFGQESAAPMRVLRFDSFNPEALGFHASEVVPYMTIPAADVAGVDADTLTVARISDMYINGEVVPGKTTFLPVYRDDDGNLVVTDFMFPDSILSDLDYHAMVNAKSSPSRAAATIIHPRTIRYVAGTFRGSLDWRADPVLIRMVPSSGVPEQRIPYTSLADAEQEAEDAKSIANAIVLVHGHNEQEKTGLDDSLRTTVAPWNYSYKRDVWTNLYRYINTNQPELANCTVFYEFIYPTYRPIFTPTGRGERLDQALAAALDRTLAQFTDANPNLNLYLVAHSMGGLVARAGIQLMDANMHSALRHLVTWGTPHMGSPLVTLRYALGDPRGAYIPGPAGVAPPLFESLMSTLRRVVEYVQVDSPGTRDLRWVASDLNVGTTYNLTLDSYFHLSPVGKADPTKYSLSNGTWLYNENLQKLNLNDIDRLSPAIIALFGVKIDRLVLSETGIGAAAIPLLMDNATAKYLGGVVGDSDGASPIVSMAGEGVVVNQRYIGDIDHEEYFGAPDEPGHFTELSDAETTAAETVLAMGIEACPEARQRTFTISGSKTLSVRHDFRGDNLPWWRAAPTTEDPSLPPDLCGPAPESISFTYSATIVVSYDSVAEPTIVEEHPDDSSSIYNVRIPGYKDPIKISGSVSFDVLPTRFEDSDLHYEIVDTEYKDVFFRYSNAGVNEYGPPTITPSGSAFSATFTDPEVDHPMFLFATTPIVTYHRTAYSLNGDLLPGGETTTQCTFVPGGVAWGLEPEHVFEVHFIPQD